MYHVFDIMSIDQHNWETMTYFSQVRFVASHGMHGLLKTNSNPELYWSKDNNKHMTEIDMNKPNTNIHVT